MRKYAFFAIPLLAVLVLSGCDFVKTPLGFSDPPVVSGTSVRGKYTGTMEGMAAGTAISDAGLMITLVQTADKVTGTWRADGGHRGEPREP